MNEGVLFTVNTEMFAYRFLIDGTLRYFSLRSGSEQASLRWEWDSARGLICICASVNSYVPERYPVSDDLFTDAYKKAVGELVVGATSCV